MTQGGNVRPARDFAGYGENAPREPWPNGARLAVNFVINYEEGAERNPLDGIDERELLAEYHYDVPPGEREPFEESTYEFGSRVGIWRTLQVLDDAGVVPTIFGCGLALERNLAVARAFQARNCDLVGHGYRWQSHRGLSFEEERAHIKAAADSYAALGFSEVLGWFTRPPQTVRTREALAREGLLFDSGSVTDDVPYFDTVDGRPFLVVPYSLDINDVRFWKNQFFTADDFASYGIDAFDVLLAEARRGVSRMMSVGLHPRIIGRPARLAGLQRLLDHITDVGEVWIARRNDIARHWAASHGPADLWNWPRVD
jgi:allantoinase